MPPVLPLQEGAQEACKSCERPAAECVFPTASRPPHATSSWCVDCHERHFRQDLTPEQREREMELWLPLPGP